MACTRLNGKLSSIAVVRGKTSDTFRIELEDYPDIGSSNWKAECHIKHNLSSTNNIVTLPLDKSFNNKAFVLKLDSSTTAQLPLGSLIMDIVVENLLDYQREVKDRIFQIELIVGD